MSTAAPIQTPARATMPARLLSDQGKPHRYVSRDHSDIRKTFAKFERLQRMRASRATTNESAAA